MLLAMFAAATVVACPYPMTDWTPLNSKRDLPPEAVSAFGDLADRGEPFQITDALSPGPRLPFSRFIKAEAKGCDLALDYEHGGIAYYQTTARFHFTNGHWVLLGHR